MKLRAEIKKQAKDNFAVNSLFPFKKLLFLFMVPLLFSLL
jgi:hypothetical protein